MERSTENTRLRADIAFLHNVVINLCLNARGAMLDGGTIFIETENIILEENQCKKSLFDLKPREVITLKVKEDDTGFEPHLLQLILNHFSLQRKSEEARG